MRAIAYLRVSTVEQAQDGHGLKAQERQVREAISQRGWQLEALYRDEGQTGKHLDRRGLMAALTHLGQADVLVVSKLDRLTRSVIDFATLLDWFDRSGRALVALDLGMDTSSPAGKMIAQILAVLAEWERDMISQRTREGLSAARLAARERGERFGHPSLVDALELAERVRGLRLEGRTFRQICDVLNEDRVPTLRGGREWRPSSLQSLLSAPARRRRRPVPTLPEVR
jgi:DNA invertase Pin-like site-specific DNA recombinase